MNLVEIEKEIRIIRSYLTHLEMRRDNMKKVIAGRKASAEIQTEKLIERCRK